MFFGFMPAVPGFYTGGIKSNGIATNGAQVVGSFYAVDTPVNNKHNRTVTTFGDLAWSPTVWALIADNDWVDAPLNRFGFA